MTYLTNADKAHMRRAAKVAEASTCRHRHGAIFAVGRRVYSVGVNSFRADPSNVTNPKKEASWHAEVTAMRSIRDVSRDGTLYVTRLGANGDAVMSRPCNRCQKTLKYLGVTRVVYSVGKGRYGVLDFKRGEDD